MTTQNMIERAYSITPTALTLASWDANSNLSGNNLLSGYTTTATAAATTTLLVGSTYQQFFTGSTTQTVLLPVTSTLVLGQGFYIVNNSSGVVTVQSSGANVIQAMASGTVLYVTCILTSGTTASSWYAEYTSQTAGANFPINTNISSMTGLTGSLRAPTAIQSSAGLNMLVFSYAASAVNYFSMNNAATGNHPILNVGGTDAVVPFELGAGNSDFWFVDATSTIAPAIRLYNAAKTHYTGLKAATAQSTDVTFTMPAADGSANFIMKTNGSAVLSLTNGSQIAGTATNDNASAGNIGELISSVIAAASAVTATANTNTDVTSITITAGDWDVWGNITWPTMGTAPVQLYAWTNTTTATPPDSSHYCSFSGASLRSNSGVNAPYQRYSVSGNTIVYLTGLLQNTSGNGTACGSIYARRAR